MMSLDFAKSKNAVAKSNSKKSKVCNNQNQSQNQSYLIKKRLFVVHTQEYKQKALKVCVFNSVLYTKNIIIKSQIIKILKFDFFVT